MLTGCSAQGVQGSEECQQHLLCLTQQRAALSNAGPAAPAQGLHHRDSALAQQHKNVRADTLPGPKVQLAPVSNSGQKQSAWGKSEHRVSTNNISPGCSSAAIHPQIRNFWSQATCLCIEPCQLPWTASCHSPDASPASCAVSDLSFICYPDTFHPPQAGGMPLHTIHMNSSPYVLLLYSLSFRLCHTPWRGPELGSLPGAVTWKLVLPRCKLSVLFGPRIHLLLPHVSSPHPGSFPFFIFAVLCPGHVTLSGIYLCSPPNLQLIRTSPESFG